MNFKMTVSKITTIKVGSVLSGQIEAGKIEVGDEIIFEIQNEKNKLEVIGISDNDKKKRVNKAEKNQDVGLLVKEKQCEKIGLQEGMIIYIPQETSEEEFFSELFGDMDQTENVTEKSVELQEKSIPQNENAIRVVIVYSDKLESISVDGTYMEDIFSIQNIPIPNWFDVKQDRNGWRGLIEEIREVIDDYDVDLNFEFNGPQESKYIFEKCISELGYGCSADGMSKDAIAKSNFAEAEKAEHRGLYQRAFDYYLKAAEHGELDKAQYKVGEYYYAFCKGEGKIDFNLTIEEGISNAISYYEMAANQGNINAQIDLYEIFYVGEYVEENDKEAFKWIKMAAQQGNAEAECSIAHAYVFGTGVEADYEEAVKWYEKAAEQGCKEAIRELGFAYRTGDLHLKNTEKMIATAGANTITLEGKCLEDNMKAGLFDADGRLITEAGTSGNADSQSATLDIPSNIGGKSDVVYTVKYAIKDTYMDEPTGKITVSNKIPATGVKLNKNNLVIAPKNREVLKAIVSPSNSTDKLSWSSTARRIASVDKNGNVSAVAPGKAVITVTTESGKKASCNVLVGLRQGDVISSGIYRYKVTDSSVDGTGQMEVAGFIKGRRAKNVTFPKSIAWNGIKYNVTSVGTRAFEANKKIKTVIIPDSVEKICHKAFYRCANMKKLTVGKNVSFFGAHAFCNNKKITKIVFKGKKLKTLKDPHVFICVNHAKVYVPKSKYKVYKKLLSTYGLGKCKFVKK